MRKSWGVRSLACMLLLPAATFARDAKPEVAPLPGWYEAAAAAGAANSTDRLALDWLLVERETRVTDAAVQSVFRNVRRVNTPEGVQDGSEVRITFDPSYERVRFHRARIVRGGKERDALPKADFRVLNREAGLEQSLLDGRLSAVLILHDVRPGDLIEIAWSLEGSPPYLAGRFSDFVYLGYSVPVARIRQRLLWPASRPLRIQPRSGAAQPRVRELGGEREYLWDGPAGAVEVDRDVPEWFEPYPAVEMTEFAGWNEVARWAAPLFVSDPAAVQSIAARWRGLPEEERAARALAFVREEVRYFGMEVGVHAHKPHAPSLVLRRRFGDCKDKALLLVSLLQALGIEARPVLANTRLRRGLDDRLPSPYVFDHAIVRATVGGKERWFDPTLTSQRGALSAISSLRYERGLVLDPATASLSVIPAPDASAPQETVEQTIGARDPAGSASVAVVSTFDGATADTKRSWFADQQSTVLGKHYLAYYRGFEPRIEQVTAPAMRDDPERDRLSVQESYRIPVFWEGGSHEVVLDAVLRLRKPRDAGTRTMPVALPYPLHVMHRARVEIPPGRDADVAQGTRTIRGPGLDSEVQTSVAQEREGAVVLITAKLTTTASEISATQVGDFARALEELENAARVDVRLASRTAQAAVVRQSDRSAPLAAVAVIAGVLGLIWVAPRARSLAQWAGSRRFLRRAVAEEGESASNPVRVRSPLDLQRRVHGQRCVCGKNLFLIPMRAGESVVLGGRTVHAVRFPCDCGQVATVYFEET